MPRPRNWRRRGGKYIGIGAAATIGDAELVWTAKCLTLTRVLDDGTWFSITYWNEATP